MAILKHISLLLPACLLFASTAGFAQVLSFGDDVEPEIYGNEITDFQWIRGMYTNHAGGSRGFGRRSRGGWWDTDYPDSDENFLRGVQRYTNIDTNPGNHEFIELTDPRLFENIFLYMNWKRVPIGSSYSGPNFYPAEIEALWRQGRDWLEQPGADIVDISLPHTKHAPPTYYIAAPAEAPRAMFCGRLNTPPTIIDPTTKAVSGKSPNLPDAGAPCFASVTPIAAGIGSLLFANGSGRRIECPKMLNPVPSVGRLSAVSWNRTVRIGSAAD